MNGIQEKSRDYGLFAVVAAALLVWCVGAWLAPPETVLILSFDGADLTSTSGLMRAGKLPHLSELNVVPMFGGPKTATKPGHAEVLTGLGYNITGVRTNKDFDSKIQPGWTIFGIVTQERPDTFVSTIFSKPLHTGDHLLRDGRREPWYGLAVWARAGGLDAYFNASEIRPNRGLTIDETMQVVEQHIAKYLAWHEATHRGQYFIYVHFADPDDTGHRYGRGSPEWDAAVIKLDEKLGYLRERLHPEVVLVYSDHGFDAPGARTHNHAPNALLASNLALQPHGNRWDVVPTLCEVLELPCNTYRPWLLGRSLIVP